MADNAKRLVTAVQKALSPDLLKPEYRAKNKTNRFYGHCYVASEALWYLLGGRESGYEPIRASDDHGVVHWWLENRETGKILDPTSKQYTSAGEKPPYDHGVFGGFLTSEPSKRAAVILERVLRDEY